MFWFIDLNASLMSQSLAISLVLEKIYINTVLTLNLFKSLKNPFNWFLITGLVLISCNSESKRFRILTLS